MRTLLLNIIRSFIKFGLIRNTFLDDIFNPYSDEDLKKIVALKNKYEGERCFVIGNGPSLNKLDLNKINDEYTFGVNGIFYKTEEMGFKPFFYTVEDKHVLDDNLEKILKYDIKYKFFPSRYKKKLGNDVSNIFLKSDRGFYETASPYFSKPRFSQDISSIIFHGQSVTIINLQIAYYLGFKEVYLIGMDFSYDIPNSAITSGLEIESTEDDPNHFHPDYFGKGKKWHDPQLDKVLASYKKCKESYEKDGRVIYNATAGGKLELFQRKNYDELFK